MVKARGEGRSSVEEGPDLSPTEAPYEPGSQVRVWWPPTEDKNKTDYAGMYWPVKVLDVLPDGLRVQYDNGEVETVTPDNVHPFSPPVQFGEERIPLLVGEFVEVSNASETDPAAWLARIRTVNKSSFTVEYPFHDSPAESIKPENIRRARLYEKMTERWMIIKPDQVWEDGEVESPLELETIDGHVLAKLLQRKEKQMSEGASRGSSSSDRKETRSRSSVPMEPAGSSKRKGKPMRART